MYEQRAANKRFGWVLGSHGIGVDLCVLNCDGLGEKKQKKTKKQIRNKIHQRDVLKLSIY